MVSFIDSQREHHGVEPICRQLPISASTYYEAKARQAWYTVPVAVLTGIPQYSNATGEMQAALGALIGPEAIVGGRFPRIARRPNTIADARAAAHRSARFDTLGSRARHR